LHVLKTLWNLPGTFFFEELLLTDLEDKVLRSFISITFPNILLSVAAFVPRSEEEGGPVRCQFISATPFTFTIPDSALDREYEIVY
jgi:hypothetical protein